MNQPRKMPDVARSLNPLRATDRASLPGLQRQSGGLQRGFDLRRMGVVLNRDLEPVETMPFVLNRAFTTTEDGWAMLAPWGKYKGVINQPGKPSRKVVQVIDREGAEHILEVFNRAKAEAGDAFPGLLVDREHYSREDRGDTGALAWIKDLAIREDGIYGRLEYSEEGKRLVMNGRVYKFLSPVFEVAEGDADGEVIACGILDAAFTNKPNLRGQKPVVNREGAVPSPETKPAATDVAESGAVMDYKKYLLKLLGLPEAATDADIEAAANGVPSDVKQMKEELATVQNRVQTLETEKLTTEAKAFVAKHAAVIKDPKKIEAAYVANKAQTIDLIEALQPEPAGKKLVVLNRAGNDAPAQDGTPTDPKELARAQRKVIGEIRNREKCSRERAFQIAEEEHPHLFPKPE